MNQLSRIIGESPERTKHIIEYLDNENIADIEIDGVIDNAKITIINRRSHRDCKLREQNRLRQKRFRENQKDNVDVTAENTNPSSSSSSSPSTSDKDKYMSIFDRARKLYPGTKRGLSTEFENFKK